MKIDNILNKEKSPDKATTASIEDIKKSQKFFSDFNDLPSATNINNNLLQDQGTIYDYLSPTTSKLKKLLNQEFLNNLSSPVKNNHLVKANNNSSVNNGAKTTKKSGNKQKLFLCSECNEHFHKLHLFNHIKSVHNKFTCLYCYGFFVDVVALEKHLVKKHKVQNTSFFDEESLAGFVRGGEGKKEVKAVCCKCGDIFNVGEEELHRHSCGGEGEMSSNLENSNLTSVPQEAEEVAAPPEAVNSNSLPPQTFHPPDVQQPPVYYPQQPPEPSNPPENCTTAKEDLDCDQPHADEPSSQAFEEQSSEEQPKLVVPKLTLKIPKAFQNYNDVESEEDSGDEESSSESPSRNEFSSLSDSDDEAKAPKPSLKLKIKNLASNNPESVLEGVTVTEEPGDEKDVDMTECPMDLEEEKVKEDETPPLIIDGIIVTPANDDVLTLDIRFDEGLDKIPIVKLMKICLKASFQFCLFCNHARKIVVNGKALATHFITHHRFHAMVDSITAEELHPEKIVSKLMSSMEELSSCFFNLETFDNQDEEKKEGHVTISHDKLYECFQCRFQTPIHKELYLHNRKMHQKSLINCLMCKMSFYSYSELLCHICPGIAHKQMFLDYKFYCCLCNLDNIPSAFRLMVHLRKKHYACDVCLEKCSDQSKLSSHVWKHKLFHLCYRCNICYRNKADIMKHLFWKHGTEGVECKKCLQKKWPHVYHFCVPPAAFTCQHCEMSFTRAMALNVHMRLHEDGAKYPCPENECEKKFVSKKLLLRHLERHQMEQTEVGTVMIPAEVPEGCCMRTLPVVFKRVTRKPVVRKIEDEVKPEVKPEAGTETKTLPDLPETNLNLSESSDSDSSEDEEKVKNARTIESLAALVEAQIEEPETRPPELAKISSLSDSDEDDEKEKEVKEEEKKPQSPQPEPEAKPAEPEEVEDKLPDKIELHVCQSDHDYAQLHLPPGVDLEKVIKKVKIEKEKKKKIKKPSDPNNDFSSSSSSGGSSSSSSSSSSGSSSSSSSTSDSSSSEASTTNVSKPRNKKFSKKRAKKEKKGKTEQEEPEVPRDPDDIICESDLVTDETDTDEDFYDEHPLKLDGQMAEKRKQLLKGGVIDGIVENSRPSTPSLPPDEKIEKKKSKKRKKEHRKRSQNIFVNPADTSMNYSHFSNPPEVHKLTSTPVSSLPPRIELHQANQIRQLLQSTQQQPVLPILKDLQHQEYINVSRVPSITSSATCSRQNSDSEQGNIKRSQRKRIPNKFYGYTSDDESMANQLTVNDPFKPIPPPNLTWRKEDLPTKNIAPRIAPLKLNLSGGEQLQQTLHTFAVENKLNEFGYESPPPPIVMPAPAVSDSDSSGEDQLHISEPRRRKRKLPPSMYAFHTLETPPMVAQPPIPRLKLTIGSNNKIRRRNINPLKASAAPKKRKLNSVPAFDPKPPLRLMQSPPIFEEATSSRQSQAQQKLDKQQKLEEAIMNTQQYFQRFNHTQVASADVAQDADGDGRVYCYCRRPYDDLQGMIGCDGSNCQIEWFHFECVGILVPPKGNWYCPECQKGQPPS